MGGGGGGVTRFSVMLHIVYEEFRKGGGINLATFSIISPTEDLIHPCFAS